MAHYRITPLAKKSIVVEYEMFRNNENGSISWFNVAETFRWGFGFLSEEDGPFIKLDDDEIYCSMVDGEMEGCELDDSVACSFEFSDDLTEEERAEIEQLYYEGGAGWLYDGDHVWVEESSHVVVYGPYKVEYCDSDGDVIRDNFYKD